MKISSGFYNLNNAHHATFKKRQIKREKPLLNYSADTDQVVSSRYKKPVTLRKALYDVIQEKELDAGVVGEKNTIQRFLMDLTESKSKILNRKVVGLAGYGSAAAAFETADGRILKLTDGNHFPMNRPVERFDVPIFKKGKAKRTHFYLEEKLYQHNLPVYFVDMIKEMISGSGYRASDLFYGDTHQLGMGKNGKLYLADSECARYKTIFHAATDKLLRVIKMR